MNRNRHTITSGLLSVIFLLFAGGALRAQQLEGCVFLQGNYVEIGVAPNGAFGTPAAAPAGYHSRPVPLSSPLYNPVTGSYQTRGQALGFVADPQKDGWDDGTPSYFGDYFMPGTVQEGYTVQVNGVKSNAWSNNYQTSGATGFTGGPLTGSNIQYITTASDKKAVWEGQQGTLKMRQTISLRNDKAYFTANIFMKNTGTDTLKKIYYMRTLDPDNEVSVTSNFSTKNKIVYQLPNPYNKTLVTATGLVFPASYLGLGTKDCQARSFFHANSLFADANLEQIYNGVVGYNYVDSSTADVCIGLVFKIGDLPPGDSTSFSFAYILNELDLDEAFSETDPGFMYNGNYYTSGSVIVEPTGTLVPLSVVNGNYYNWTWAPGSFLNTTVGPNVDATVSTGPITYTATGVGTGVVASRCSNRTLDITISPYPVVPPPAVFNSNIFYCQNQPAGALQASGPGLKRWYTTSTGGVGSLVAPTPSTAVPGTFIWYVSQEIDGIESARVPVTVIVRTPPVINTVPATPYVCAGDTLKMYLTGTPATYTWTSAPTLLQGTPNDTVRVFPISATTYTVQATDNTGCRNTRQILVDYKLLPAVSVSPDAANVCRGDSVVLTGGLPGLNFSWSPAALLSSTTGDQVKAYPQQPNTIITVTGSDAFGCRNKAQAVLTLKSLPVADLGPDRGLCAGSDLILQPGSFSSYLWQDGATSPTFATSVMGLYWVEVTDNFGCKDRDSILVNSQLQSPADFLPDNLSFCKGNQLTVKVSGYQQYLWSNGSTDSKTTFTAFGYITLEVKDSYGCIGKDTAELKDAHCIPFAVPSGFTPNGDGLNDIFRPTITQLVKGYKMEIRNRWGQLLYATNNARAGWDGTIGGIKQATGVYVYLIAFTDADGKPVSLKGTLTLIR